MSGKIAIVAVSCILPGAHSPEAFWELLQAQHDARKEGSDADFGLPKSQFMSDTPVSDKVYCATGGFVENFTFESDKYVHPDVDVGALDDVFKWPLHCAAEVLERKAKQTMDLSRTGIVLGNYTFPTKQSNALYVPFWHEQVAQFMGSELDLTLKCPARDHIASENRHVCGSPPQLIAKLLGLGGPAYGLDAACSSALYAIKLSIHHLLSGQVDQMLAGGVSASDPWVLHSAFSDFHAFPQDGYSQPFESRSQGIQIGQGAGIFVLKRLEDALLHEDEILAVIEGVGLSNDGAGKHMLVPSEAGQILAYERAFKEAGIDKSQLEYIECHATGTPLGDQTELNSLAAYFNAQSLKIGSVKGNTGHLLSAAGISSLMKVILSLQHEMIAPTRILSDTRSADVNVALDHQIVTQSTPWQSEPEHRYAAISAFGFGGTNAHMLLSDNTQPHGAPATEQKRESGPIAITGMGAHFGPFDSLSCFEQAIFNEQSGVRPLSEQRARGFALDTQACGYVDEFDFEPLRFKVQPKTLAQFNQQQLLMLKVAEEALQSAKVEKGKLRNVAVIFVMELDSFAHIRRAKVELPTYIENVLQTNGVQYDAARLSQWSQHCAEAIFPKIGSDEVLSYIGNLMASRISSAWDFNGPAFTLSSTDDGVHHAMEVAKLLMAASEVDGVLIGAVDMGCNPEELWLAQSDTKNLQPGEGAGAIFLEQSELAKARDARVFAHIETPPNTQQIDTEAMSLGLIEVPQGHANMADLAQHTQSGSQSVALGSVQSVTGSGAQSTALAGLIKAALCLHHRYIPKSTAASDLLASGQFEENWHCAQQSYPWVCDTRKLKKAALVHLCPDLARQHNWLLTEGDWPTDNHILANEFMTVPFAGDSLQQLKKTLAEAVEAMHSDKDLIALRRTCLLQYDTTIHSTMRAAIVAQSVAQFQEEVGRLLQHFESPEFTSRTQWKTPIGSRFDIITHGESLPVAFVYPGAFNAYVDMGRGFFRLFPQLLKGFEQQWEDPYFAMAMDEVYPKASNPLNRRDYMELERALQDDVAAMMCSGGSLAIFHTQMFKSQFNVKPDFAFGYSLGESCMLFANDVWQIEGETFYELKTSPLFEDVLVGPTTAARAYFNVEGSAEPVWHNYVVLDDAQKVRQLCEDHDALFLTHINSPSEVVIGGQPEALSALIETHALSVIKTPNGHMLHNEAMRSAEPLFREMCGYQSRGDVSVRLFSGSQQGELTDFTAETLTHNIADMLCKTVDFPNIINRAYAEGARLFIEVGPGGTCSRWVAETLGDKPHTVLSVDARNLTDIDGLNRLFAQLFTLGVSIDVSHLIPAEPSKVLSLPIPVGGQDMLADIQANTPSIDSLVQATFATGERTVPQTVSHPVSSHDAAVSASHSVTHVSTMYRKSVNHDLASKPALTVALTDNAIITTRECFANCAVMQSSIQSSSAANAPEGVKPDSAARTQWPQEVAPAASLLTNHRLLSKGQAHKTALHHRYLQAQNTLTEQVFDYVHTQIDRMTGTDTITEPVAKVLSEQPKKAPALYEVADIEAEAEHIAPKAPESINEAVVNGDATQSEGDQLKPVEILGYKELKAFAAGKIADAFGPEYAEIDQYATRVRLPDDPYFFVSRVTRLEATRHELKPCMLTTEYDIPEDAWYLIDGVVPPGIAVEAGQCDLLLISYLGVDFFNKGERRYRLLDGKMTFLDNLPRGGQTLRFDIYIENFVWQGDVLLFFFRYDGYADDKPVMQLEGGCAGFFNQQELDNSLGVVLSNVKTPAPQFVKPLLQHTKTSLTRNDLIALSRGKIEDVFGETYKVNPRNTSIRLPDEKLIMIDEITHMAQPQPSGTVKMIGTQYLDPEAWFFKCHFVDDQVMAGSLVAEGAIQMLRVYLISLGMHHCFELCEFQPVPGELMDIKVRGQIDNTVPSLRYELEIFETGFVPRPYVKAHAVIYDGDKPAVLVENLSFRITESPNTQIAPRANDPAYFSGRVCSDGTPAVLNEFHMAHCGTGSLGVAMGRDFELYDGRVAPRVPNLDFKFIDRVVALNGQCKEYADGSTMIAEYDVPNTDWYYDDNYGSMPLTVLLETSLQSALCLGYLLGPTLNHPDKTYHIRNLQGTTTYLKDIDLRGKTIRHHITLLSTTVMPESILQNLRFDICVEGESFYQGESVFGFFTHQMMAKQVGLDNGDTTEFWYEQQALDILPYKVDNALVKPAIDSQDMFAVSKGRLAVMDEVYYCPLQGVHKAGYVFVKKFIQPDDWYFKYHFHDDPVMPGSLGIEAFVQAVRLYAVVEGIGKEAFNQPCFSVATDIPMNWMYRGQILPTDDVMNVEVHIERIEHQSDRILIFAQANLFNDHLRIYNSDSVVVEIKEKQS
ncbi:hypothetical protein L1286_15730 [Pseudoalteromonas sp. SMS1]|uniref:beta-ketoacyl synthase N-terminal-like domain-containing protein n=1 Tax=Pseudoalteromonas sp. SMS1 TaxID=2908894 RepID=UPI001F3D9F8D|nr:beta-ketoacyl synthase N-terminal-like domain-containing protein [Pseudoalteromonas sp. SMS1]MCF2858937.1 hypothetical protein [Pseudoalteromonas sp. SMS1]